MFEAAKRLVATHFVYPLRKHWHGNQGIERMGHRKYVGGRWDQIGQLQWQTLMRYGLLPHHHLLDVGCGCLRAGRYFIDYLETGHYHGFDKENALVAAGKGEIGEKLQDKQPQLWVTNNFNCHPLSVQPDFILAHSLFTHLNRQDISLALQQLRSIAKPSCVFLASFFETHSVCRNPIHSHDHCAFYYTFEQIRTLASNCGWQIRRSKWAHPRGQKLLRFVPVAHS